MVGLLAASQCVEKSLGAGDVFTRATGKRCGEELGNCRQDGEELGNCRQDGEELGNCKQDGGDLLATGLNGDHISLEGM